jgi:hypothetical protein
MLGGSAGVVGDQEGMGHLVASFGMIPEPAHILDELAFVAHQYVVDGDRPFWAAAASVVKRIAS